MNHHTGNKTVIFSIAHLCRKQIRFTFSVAFRLDQHGVFQQIRDHRNQIVFNVASGMIQHGFHAADRYLDAIAQCRSIMFSKNMMGLHIFHTSIPEPCSWLFLRNFSTLVNHFRLNDHTFCVVEFPSCILIHPLDPVTGFGRSRRLKRILHPLRHVRFVLNRKPDMLIHPDVLVRKCHIVPNAGAVADVGHPVDPRAGKKFAHGFRFPHNVFKIFIRH